MYQWSSSRTSLVVMWGDLGYNNFFSEARLRPNSHHKLLIDRFVPQRIGTAGNLVLADTSPSDENQPDGIKKEDS